jgi:hypothetical protein
MTERVTFGGVIFERPSRGSTKPRPFNGAFDYMFRPPEQRHITEDYVSTPPALTITDERGDIWCLGPTNLGVSGGEFSFTVLRNGVPTGERANRIERRAGKISIFGPEGRKAWNGRTFI